MPLFTSDNVTPACPEVLAALVEANSGPATSYGNDAWTERLQQKMLDLFEKKVRVFPVVTGTAANALALSALSPSYGKIYCHPLAHINTDECSAPEFFSGGGKLVLVPGVGGKLRADDIEAMVAGGGDVHQAQPAAVSIAQACETGRIYQIDEITGIASMTHAHGMKLHMDGARFANALSALNVTPAEMTWKAGVDVLSFGGTKNGCLMAEAVVFFDPDAAEGFAYLHKRAGQLLSKIRFVSAQLEAYIKDGLWLRNARRANAMAARLSAGLATLPGLELAFETEANEVFVHIPNEIAEKVRAEGFDINADDLDRSAVRFVTAWNSTPDDVDRLLASFRKHCR